MKIITDCDGVLVDWMEIYHKWITNEGYIKKNDSYELHERYSMEEDISDTFIRHFNMSAEVEFLPPLRDSIKYVRKLHEEHGISFHCITAMGTNKKSHILRKKNLENLFGKTAFAELDCVKRGKDKKPLLQEYTGEDVIWIEDSVDNAIVGHYAGLKTFLMVHEHNVDRELPEGIIRVNNWKEIYEHLFG